MHYVDRSIDAFLDDVASSSVAPAGGTVVAVVGAAGTALCEMACVHTMRADDVSRSEPALSATRSALERRRNGLLTLADSDARVVDSRFGSSGGRSGSSGERSDSSDEGESTVGFSDNGDRRGLKRSIGVPLTIAESCGIVIELGEAVLDGCVRSVRVDAWVGLSLVYSALEAAVFTVRHNLEVSTDAEFNDRVRTRLAETEAAVATVFERVTDDGTFDPRV